MPLALEIPVKRLPYAHL